MDKDIYRLIIQKEIDKFKVEYGLKHPDQKGRWWIEFFNNFILVLICWQRKNLKEAGQLGEFFGQEGSSEKFKRMTVGDFFDHIEQTVKDCAINQKSFSSFSRKLKKHCHGFWASWKAIV